MSKNDHRFWRLTGASFIFTLLILVLWWRFFRTVETIETETVSRTSIENIITALGTLQPHNYVDVGEVHWYPGRSSVLPSRQVT